MHSFLITGSAPDLLAQKAGQLFEKVTGIKFAPEKQPDLLLLEPESASDTLKIDQVRQLKKDLSIRPIQMAQKVALIRQAHQLTPAAQNALLKTLEEPPGQTLIILTSTQPDLLLATIRSRCQQIKVQAPAREIDLETEAKRAEQIIKANPGKRLKLVDEWGATKENLLEFIENQTYYWHHELTSPTSFWERSQILRALQALQEAQKNAGTQVNTLLVFDHLLSSFPGPKT